MRGLVVGLLLACVACSAPEAEPLARGTVGVFYGGQVQELDSVTWTSERLPSLGFRLEFRDEEPHRVSYEITRPGPAGRRVTELGRLERPRERRVLEQPIALEPTSPLGTWNVRVSVDDHLTVDRAFWVAGLRSDAR